MRLTGEDKTVFLPGKTTHGHYQIEMACDACHSDSFAGGEVLQKACVKCHGEELRVADDSHPMTKFTDPRNADRVAKLDARKCITCHTEHNDEITQTMGVTLPDNFCVKCHYDVAENRPSHKGMAFSTCASAGCHNFHDNRGLYEDFLAKHLDEPDVLSSLQLSSLSKRDFYQTKEAYPVDEYPIRNLSVVDADIPGNNPVDSKILQDWSETAHGKSGVNCSACHEIRKKGSNSTVWLDKPDHGACKNCHTEQTSGFLSGKHGMRLAQGLGPMSPAIARSKMKPTSHSRELSCTSCHSAHNFNIQHAAVEACLGCHDDKHSNAYKQSVHYQLWYRETTGQTAKNTGVSCATCHLPRKEVNAEGKKFVIAEHNQNDNLRPNEKMLRSVCMQCHGLGFSINALADKRLIETNFSERPGVSIDSLELVKKRLTLKKDVEGM